MGIWELWVGVDAVAPGLQTRMQLVARLIDENPICVKCNRWLVVAQFKKALSS
jgi:hypothetical protein